MPTRFNSVQANCFVGSRFPKQGKEFFVQPYYGNGDIENPEGGVKTLAAALAACAEYKNDTVNLLAGHKTGTYTTDYLAATCDWNKSLTHLIGTPGSIFSQRSRVAFADSYDTASNLFTVSADFCRFENIQFFEGVAGTNPTGCVKVTGNRNSFNRCHIAGIGHDNNDIANAYSLYVSGSENVFEDCTIGLDTISRGTGDNAELVLAGGGARNVFIRCRFITYGAVNTHQFVKRPVSGSDRIDTFIDCSFQNYDWAAGGGATLLEVFDVTASGSPGGLIDLSPGCWFSGAAAWEASSGASTIVRYAGTTATAASATTGGRALAVTGA